MLRFFQVENNITITLIINIKVDTSDKCTDRVNKLNIVSTMYTKGYYVGKSYHTYGGLQVGGYLSKQRIFCRNMRHSFKKLNVYSRARAGMTHWIYKVMIVPIITYTSQKLHTKVQKLACLGITEDMSTTSTGTP